VIACLDILIIVGQNPRYGRVLAHDDPRAACRGTGVVTEVIYRAALLTADRDPRESEGHRM